jgi:hypothetical protein
MAANLRRKTGTYFNKFLDLQNDGGQRKCVLRLSRRDNNVSKSTAACRLEGRLGKLPSGGKIYARQIDLFEPSHDLSSEQLGLDLPHHLNQRIAVIFDQRGLKASLLQNCNIPFRRQRIPDAGDPRQQSFKPWNCSLGSRQVAESQLSAWFEHAIKLLRCNRLAGECAEGALAEDRIKSFDAKRQPLGIAELKANLSGWSALRCFHGGQTHILFTQIHASDFAAE